MRYKIIYDSPDGENSIIVSDHESDMDLWSMIAEQYPEIYDQIEEPDILEIRKISNTYRWNIKARTDTGFISWNIEAPDNLDFYALRVFDFDDPFNTECLDWLKTHAPDIYKYAAAGKIYNVTVIE